MKIYQKLKAFFSKRKTVQSTNSESDFISQDDISTILEQEKLSPEKQAKTLKRKFILLFVAGFIVFIIFSIFNALSKPSMPKREQLANQTNAGKDITTSNMPSGYGDLAKYQAEHQSKQHKNIQQKHPKGNLDNQLIVPSSIHSEEHQFSSQQNNQQENIQQKHPKGNLDNQLIVPSSIHSEEHQFSSQQSKAEKLATAIANSNISFNFSNSGNSSGNSINQATAPLSSDNYSLDTTKSEVSAGQSHKLQAGSVIQATLLTGITSDIPKADVVAQVRQNIYDSLRGEYILIPQGSRLIGKTAEVGGRGNKKLGVAFTRLIYPNGKSILLPSQQAIDGTGYPGLSDKYDDHGSTLYRTAFFSALFSAAVQSSTGNSSGKDNRSPGQEAASGTASNILDTAKKLVERDMNMHPTITIRPGMQFSVFLNKDLSLIPY